MPDHTNSWLRRIRDALRRAGSPEHAKGVQWFFKEEIRSHGWYTAALRRFARQTSREIQATDGTETLLKVADKLFTGEVLEEKNCAVMLLENSVGKFGDREFRLFESWLDRVSSWADHDALVHYLIGPMIVAKPKRARYGLRWAKSRNRWRRRAAAVSLIHSARRRILFPQIVRVSEALLTDQDDMSRKAWDGCCAKPPRPTARRPFPVFSAFATARRAWCCELLAKPCRLACARGCSCAGPKKSQHFLEVLGNVWEWVGELLTGRCLRVAARVADLVHLGYVDRRLFAGGAGIGLGLSRGAGCGVRTAASHRPGHPDCLPDMLTQFAGVSALWELQLIGDTGLVRHGETAGRTAQAAINAGRADRTLRLRTVALRLCTLGH